MSSFLFAELGGPMIWEEVSWKGHWRIKLFIDASVRIFQMDVYTIIKQKNKNMITMFILSNERNG